MTTSDPDPDAPVDYPPDAGLPPPVYPPPYPGPAGYPGYPGAPGYYAGAYDPYRPSKPPGTNGMAIASLVASLVGFVPFCFFGIGSIIGIVLGIVALNQIKQTREGGHGLAIAGIVVGGVSLLISVFWTIITFSH